jgi:hypothetical protein
LALFKRHRLGNRLPSDIADLMDRFGRYEFNPSGNLDGGDMWADTQQPLLEFASNDPSGFLSALATEVTPLGGWTAYGAGRTALNLLNSDDRIGPSYKTVMDGDVDFLRSSGVPPMHVAGYEWERWLERGGTVDTWIPRRPIPSLEEAFISELQLGEVRRLTHLGSAPDSNFIVVKQEEGGRFCALIDAKWSSEDPTRSQSEWKSADTLYGIYIETGLMAQSGAYWHDPELEPYFPLPVPKIPLP